MTEQKKASEIESQAKSVWPFLCAVIVGSSGAIFCSTVWGREPKPYTLFLTLGSIAIGAILGLSLRESKGKRKISLFVSLAFFVSFFALGRYLVSDFALVKKEWKVHNIGLTSFSYPSDFWQKAVPLNFLQNGDVLIFTNENTKRYAAYMIYDFNDYYPELTESLSAAVLSLLSSFGSQFDSWEQNEFDSAANTIKTRFNYTFKGKEYTGVAYAASSIVDEQNAHYELLMFFPLRKKYSAALIERIENEIKAN